jgi:hypothetical protein
VPSPSATAGRRAPAKPRGDGRSRKPAAAQPPGILERWWKVALLVALATIGLPVGHALFGELVAIVGASVVVGFLLGRWTV